MGDGSKDRAVPSESLARVMRLARVQGGVLSRGQLRDCGYSHERSHRRVVAGEWGSWEGGLTIPMLDQPDPDAITAWKGRLRVGPTAIISGTLAARLDGFDVPNLVPLVLAYPRAPHPVAGLRFIQPNSEVPDRSTRYARGLKIRRGPAAVMDALSVARPKDFLQLLDLALQRRWLTGPLLRRELSGRREWWIWGTTALRRALEYAEGGARSEAERRMKLILQRAKLSGWRANHPVVNRCGRVIAEIDFAHGATMLAIEVDGRAHHTSREAFERDRVRQNTLHELGWVVLRFTWEQITRNPLGVEATVRRALARSTRKGVSGGVFLRRTAGRNRGERPLVRAFGAGHRQLLGAAASAGEHQVRAADGDHARDPLPPGE